MLTAPLCAPGEHKPFLALVSHTSRTSFSEHRPFSFLAVAYSTNYANIYFLTLLPHYRASLSRWKRYVPNLANHAAIQFSPYADSRPCLAHCRAPLLRCSRFLTSHSKPSIVGCFLTLAGPPLWIALNHRPALTLPPTPLERTHLPHQQNNPTKHVGQLVTFYTHRRCTSEYITTKDITS